MGTLYVARHGESIWNASRRIQGQSDVPLSERGVRQAEALAERLASERIDFAFASDLQRAHLTARAVVALQPELREPLRVRAALRERKYGSWEGLTSAEVRVLRERLAVPAALTDPPLTTTPDVPDGPPDAETFGELVERSMGAWPEVAEVLGGGTTVLIVGHAASLRALLCGLTATPAAGQRRWQMDNAALSRLTWLSGSLRVGWWNDAAHTRPVYAATGRREQIAAGHSDK